jgi:hypothetical protein
MYIPTYCIKYVFICAYILIVLFGALCLVFKDTVIILE